MNVSGLVLVSNYRCPKLTCILKKRCMLWSSFESSFTELPVFFSQELQHVEAEEGGEVCLCCELSKPEKSVQWKKNNLPLRSSGRYEMKQDSCLLQLHIKDLTPEDTGRYSCQTGPAVTVANVKVKGVQPYENRF